MREKPFGTEEIIKRGPFEFRLPNHDEFEQDEEYFDLKLSDEWERIRFHDYNRIYGVRGLYETLFYRTLLCNSPSVIADLITISLRETTRCETRELRFFDFGAGNGMAGEALQNIGVRSIVALDILEDARQAALRDRPWVYDDYMVEDFTRPTPETLEKLRSFDLNAMCIVAALGFGDIPPKAFFNAYNLIADGGLIAFNVRDLLFWKKNKSPYSVFLQKLLSSEHFQLNILQRYRHRISTRGEPLHYLAVVGQKLKSLDESFLA